MYYENDPQKQNYAFNMLKKEGLNPDDFMYMYESNDVWYFKHRDTRHYHNVNKVI
tara:strand:- start:335 stop:499 length:165 start_codon:yes stop_codon:yes gene_type:complete